MKKRLLLLPCLMAIGATSLAVGLASANGQQGWSAYTAEAEYAYKSTFTVTDRTYTDSEGSYEATAVVCYPDGTVSSEKEVELSQVGIYTVKYTAKAGERVYADSYTFLVNYPAYSVSAEKSSVRYGTPDRATTAGVMARIAQGDSLEYTKYIDFTKVSIDDKLVSGYVTPDTAGVLEFSQLTLTFTDSVDESVYFQVHYYGYDWTYNTYAATGTNNQVPVGMHQSEGLKVDNKYGLWSYVAFNSVGQTGVAAPDATQFYVSMNYAEKQVYTLGFPGVNSMIADLDDPAYVTNAWAGFPSGKARLSVTASGHAGATANVCITEVCGIPAQELADNIYLDTDKPTITVDGTYEHLPEALVGREYTIPEATAYDAYGYDCKVQTRVWYNYGLQSPVQVPVQDGKFFVGGVGTYGIEYVAYDKVGNASSTTKMVRAFETIEPAEFEIPSERTTSAYVGEWVNVPTVLAEDVTGGSGNSTVAVYAEFDGEREEIVSGFRALKLGTYKVVYVATDYVGTEVEKSYEVTITAGTQPILEEDLDMYSVYVSGQSYVLPAFYAYSYNGGKLEKSLCDVVITDGQGTNTYKAGGAATIAVAEHGDEITIEVKSGGVTLATHKAVGAQVWVQEEKGLRLHFENYLVGEGFTTEKTSTGMLLTSENSALRFTYANAISTRQMNARFTDLVSTSEDASFTVMLTDAADATVSLSVTIGKMGAGTYVEVGGERKTMPVYAFDGGEFVISYEKGILQVGEVSIDCSSMEFVSDRAFLSVACSGVAEIVFAELGNCRFSTVQTDRVSPVLMPQHEIGGCFQPNSRYHIVAPICYDVYSPNMVYTLTVEGTDGQPIKDINGVVLNNVDPTQDYFIDLNKIGTYLVKYEAREADSFVAKTNPVSLMYTLTVSDEVAPKLSWKGEFAKTAKVGDVVIVPDYEVTDNHNVADEIVVRVFVETPAHQLFMLPGNSIKVTHVGTYQFRVIAVDASGNVTTAPYEMTVSA